MFFTMIICCYNAGLFNPVDLAAADFPGVTWNIPAWYQIKNTCSYAYQEILNVV